MKRLIIGLPIFCALTFTGCKKYLEHVPDNRTNLDTPEKVSQLLGSAYPKGNYMAFAESISDNVADKGVGRDDAEVGDPFFFKDVASDAQDSPEGYWGDCYAAIAAANHALEVCNTAADSTAYRAQKGEALVARAYAHFMLVTFFSKVYDAATADSDPGIPYVTEPETVVFKKYERKTVSYVYQMIEKDLTEGLPLLNDQRYSVPRYHFTQSSAHAFASRFYLFKKDYAKVIEHANLAFPGNNFLSNMRPWNTTYEPMTYGEISTIYSKATEPANLLLVETVSRWPRYYAIYRYGLTADLVEEIFGRNVTGGTWIFNSQIYTQGGENYLLPKFTEHFVQASVNANTGVIYQIVPLLQTEEVLLNRAEAYALSGNNSAAIADLNLYASTRINNYNATTHRITVSKVQSFYGTANTQLALLLTILDFKRAEFVQEGLRWFDILRWNIPVVHTTAQGETMELKADDPRRLFQVPSSGKLSGIDPNPR